MLGHFISDSRPFARLIDTYLDPLLGRLIFLNLKFLVPYHILTIMSSTTTFDAFASITVLVIQCCIHSINLWAIITTTFDAFASVVVLVILCGIHSIFGPLLLHSMHFHQ